MMIVNEDIHKHVVAEYQKCKYIFISIKNKRVYFALKIFRKNAPKHWQVLKNILETLFGSVIFKITLPLSSIIARLDLKVAGGAQIYRTRNVANRDLR